MNETVDKPVDTVTIEIDGVEMQAPKGSMIIEAADKVGIRIPRFCYHNKLSIAANCRMCLVDVEKAPKPMPACATPVMDGMKVYTQSKRAVSSQQNVMEFLLINHPLDCPICDQGGECELQDLSMGYGKSVSRFTERKRVVKDENLGSLVSTDMTRCIHCTRCVRFLEEIGGTSELGGMGRGETTFISTFIGRSIDSELSGNIIDLCPVGALTNKPFRFRARAWEMRSREAVAAHDAVGSNHHLHVCRGRVLRSVPKDNEAVNEAWLSDRDRWGIEGLYATDRAAEPQVKTDGEWQSPGWEKALSAVAEAMGSVPADQVGMLVSPRTNTESLYLAQKLMRSMGSGNIDHRLTVRDFADQDAQPAAPGFEMPIAEMSAADGVLLVGSNPRHEAPILGHKVRQAWRAGARIAAINAVDYDFHFDLHARAITSPLAMVDALAAVARELGAKAEGALGQRIQAAQVDDAARSMAEVLRSAQRGLILLGDVAVQSPVASWLRGLARAIASATDASLNEMPTGANGAGAWMAGAVPHRGPGGSVSEVTGKHVRAMLADPPKVMILLDVEPSLDMADGSAWRQALLGADRVVYLGAWASEEIRELADVIIPLVIHPEAPGSLVNADGRSQFSPGPGTGFGDAREAWKVLRVLGNLLELEGFEYTRLAQVSEEVVAHATDVSPASGDTRLADWPEGEGLELLVERPIYAVDGLVRRSKPLQDTVHGEPGAARVHPANAQGLGEEVTLSVAGVQATLPVRVDERMAPGTVRIPGGVAASAGLVNGTRAEVVEA